MHGMKWTFVWVQFICINRHSPMILTYFQVSTYLCIHDSKYLGSQTDRIRRRLTCLLPNQKELVPPLCCICAQRYLARRALPPLPRLVLQKRREGLLIRFSKNKKSKNSNILISASSYQSIQPPQHQQLTTEPTNIVIRSDFNALSNDCRIVAAAELCINGDI